MTCKRVLNLVGWPTRIRTLTNRTKICCATVTPWANTKLLFSKAAAKIGRQFLPCNLWLMFFFKTFSLPGTTAGYGRKGRGIRVLSKHWSRLLSAINCSRTIYLFQGRGYARIASTRFSTSCSPELPCSAPAGFSVRQDTCRICGRELI